MSAFDCANVYTTAGAPGVAVSGTTTYLSDWTYLGVKGYISWQVEVTGTPTGTLSVQVQNETDYSIAAGSDLPIDDQSVPIPASAISGAATSFMVETQRCVRRARLKYVNTSGTGTLFAKRVTR